FEIGGRSVWHLRLQNFGRPQLLAGRHERSLFSLARHWEWQALWPWPLTARLLGRTIRSWCRLKFRSRRLPDAWDGITPQLSDFHYDDRFSVVPLRKASDVVNPLCPDLREILYSSSLQEIST